MSDSLTYTDRFGNIVRPGSWIVYGRLLGRCATTGIGRVIEVKEKEPQYNYRTKLIEPAFKIVIDSIQDDQQYNPKPYVKRTTLQEIERVILYDEARVSKEILALFNA